MKEWLGFRYSKHEVNLGTAFLNEGIPELLRVNRLLISLQAFHNVRSILEELQILVAPGKEQKKVFPEVPIVAFRNDKYLKDYLVTAALPKLEALNHVERVLVNCVII